MLAAPALAGCGLGAGPAPTAVKLLVTRDFGTGTLRGSTSPKVAGSETVMSLLMRNARVQTRFAGGFVQSIDGIAGGHRDGEPADWFYYVNGVEASEGAAETDLHPGDHVWWDLHDWSQTEHIPAVVGSFPEPFLNGTGGKRLPVRIECESVSGSACRAVDAELHRLGVPAAISAPGGGPAGHTLRVLVAAFATVGAEPAAQALLGGPRASGVYARFAAGGHALVLLDADGRVVRTLEAGAGLIAATMREGEAPVWLVTGTDPAGVALAARSFTAAALGGRFALAAAAGRTWPLPVVGG
ncbi:MAG TPA: DUF4430 domain-containing protein [Solirubrobacteraceae bacterium]|nr:DUF4430 domain-containing protein [Solirubrobacteraceae bacterium]